MEAIFPEQSETSRYRLVIMDRDGSNRRELFPEEGRPGLEVQTPTWAPSPRPDGSEFLAVIYQGNLWLIDVTTGQAQPVTGDGLMSNIDWK
jgi:Tol biopolymer transport system component